MSEFLSFSTCGELLRISVTGACHVAPLSTERLTSIPLFRAPNGVVGCAGSNTSEKKKAVPSFAKSTQGSEARRNLPPVQSVTPDGIELVQVLPASMRPSGPAGGRRGGET